MDNEFTADGFGVNINLTIPYDQFSDLVVSELIETARQIEFWKDPREVEVWEALMVVIPYFARPSQMKDLADYQADADWINIVANKAA